MYDWELEQAKQSYAKLVHAFETGILPDGTYGEIMENGIRIFGDFVYHKDETEEEYLARNVKLKRKKYPVNLYAFLQEGVWITADRFIADGENSRIEDNAEWEDELEQFIENLDDEKVLVTVDCHM